MIRVCILSGRHPADDSRVTHRLGRSLAGAGFDVTWVGPFGSPMPPDTGMTFERYAAGHGRLARLLHARRMQTTAQALPPQDIYLAVEPDSAAVACDLARQRGGRVIFDVHEVYHDESLRAWLPDCLIRPAGLLVRRAMQSICRRCDLVIGPGRTRLDPYVARGQETLVVRHCVPRALAPTTPSMPFAVGRPHLTLLHGKTAEGHGTRIVIEAAERLKKQGVSCRIVLFRPPRLMAHGRELPVERLARELGVPECLDLRDPLPFEAFCRLLTECDVGVIAYGRDLGVRCLPNRVFEYLAAGLPVVVPSYAVELQPLLARYRCGLSCDMERPDALADALLHLWRHPDEARAMGLAGRKAFEDELNWETEVAPLVKWIKGQETGDGGQGRGGRGRGQETGDGSSNG